MRESDPIPKKTRALVVCLLIALSLYIYSQTFYFEHVDFDDTIYVFKNPYVQEGFTPYAIKWAFTAGLTFTTEFADYWQPLTFLTRILDVRIFGLNAGGHHFTNVLIHIFNTCLLFLLFVSMTKETGKSAFVAALFAVHPLQVESVAWITERKDVLASFFWMTTMIAYTWYIKNRTVKRYLLVVISFACGLMSKPLLLPLPFILIAMELWPLKTIKLWPFDIDEVKRISLAIIPLLVLCVISVYITMISRTASMTDMSVSSKIGSSFVTYFAYLKKVFFPSQLIVPYPPLTYPLPGWVVIISVIGLAAMTWLFFRARRSAPFLLFGWFWFLISLAPVVSLTDVGGADRWTYIPIIGIGIILAWGVPAAITKFTSQKPICFALSGILIMILTMQAHQQASHWKNTGSLFGHTLSSYPNNYLGLLVYGRHFANEGDLNKALFYYEKAYQINPNHELVQNNLGHTKAKLGRIEEAAYHFRQGIRLRPNQAPAYDNLGVIYAMKNENDKAIELYKKALHANPDHRNAHVNIGIAYVKNQDYENALKHFSRVLQLARYDPESLYQMGVVHHELKNYQESADWLKRSISKVPNHALAHAFLGRSLKGLGRNEEAISEFQISLRQDQSNGMVHHEIGVLYGRKGKMENAGFHLEKAVKLRPFDTEVLHNYGEALAAMGYSDSAIVQFREVVKLDKKAFGAANSLAWMLATTVPRSKIRSKEALEMALLASVETDFHDAGILDTLAAAYAASGDFKSALAVIDSALIIARGNFEVDRVRSFESHRERFLKKQAIGS